MLRVALSANDTTAGPRWNHLKSHGNAGRVTECFLVGGTGYRVMTWWWIARIF